MIEMNTHIFEYFMNSNEKTNESLKNSMNSIVQIIQKLLRQSVQFVVIILKLV